MKIKLLFSKFKLNALLLMMCTFLLAGCGELILQEPELEYDGTRTIISNVGEHQYQIAATTIDWISSGDGTYKPQVRLLFENSTSKDLKFAVYGTEIYGENVGCSEDIIVPGTKDKYAINTSDVTIDLAQTGVSKIPDDDTSMTFNIGIYVGKDTQASQTMTLRYTPNNEYVIFEIVQ